MNFLELLWFLDSFKVLDQDLPDPASRHSRVQGREGLYMSDIRFLDIELVLYRIVKCLSWFVNQAGGISKLPIYKSIFMTVSLWTK